MAATRVRSGAGASGEAMLSVEPVTGWRTWYLSVDENWKLALFSPSEYSGYLHWYPRQQAHATCFLGWHRSEVPPVEWCTCGIHGASSIRDLARAHAFGYGIDVVGTVSMWGTVIEHKRGYRSTFAYPSRLRLVCRTCLKSGRVANPVVVVDRRPGGLTPLCERHRRRDESGRDASEVLSELLAKYGVDLLPEVAVTPMMRVHILTDVVLRRFSRSLDWLTDQMDDGGVKGYAIALVSALGGILALSALIKLLVLAMP